MEMDDLEKEIVELVAAIHSLRKTENDLCKTLASKVNDADKAECEKAVALQSAAEARAEAAAASTSSEYLTAALAVARSQLTGTKLQVGTVEHQCLSLEQRCAELSLKVQKTKRDVQQLRAAKFEKDKLQRLYSEYENRVNRTIEKVQSEKVRLQEELRNLERCVAGGEQLRERARLVAAAHSVGRLLAESELKQFTEDLRKANSEIAHLKISSLKASDASSDIGKQARTLLEKMELRSLLRAEKMGEAQLQRALCAAQNVNAELKKQLPNIENREAAASKHVTSQNTNIPSSHRDNNLSQPSSNP